jgi:hypothetical protein
MTSNNNSTDDGSLSFLNIQPDEANKLLTARKPRNRN